MSTTVSEPVASGQPLRTIAQVPDLDRAGRIRRTVALATVALAPIIFISTGWLHPDEGDTGASMLRAIEAHRVAWYAVHAVLGPLSLLMLPALGAVAARVRGRGAGLVTGGAWLSGIGVVGEVIAMAGHGLLGYAVSQRGIDPAVAAQLLQWFDTAPGVMPFNMGAIVIWVGMMLLGAGLWRTRRFGKLVPLVVGLSIFPLAAFGRSGLSFLIAGSPLIVGFALLARRLAAPETY